MRLFERPAALLLALGLAGCRHAQPAPERPPVPLASAESRPAPSDPPPLDESRLLEMNLEAAERAAAEQGWVMKQRIDLLAGEAAALIYAPGPENPPASLSSRIDVVGWADGAPHSEDSGMIDVLKPQSGGYLWDLKGNGSRSLVITLTACGAHCGASSYVVLDYSAGKFQRAAAAPECPACLVDKDSAGVPVFGRELSTLSIAPCSYASCGTRYALDVSVDGLESWDGSAYSTRLKSLAPLYRRSLDRAEADASKLNPGPNLCPTDAISAAARVYLYSRILGAKEADARKRAEGIMRGFSTAPCAKHHDLLAPPKPWAVLLKELVSTSIPSLDQARKPARGQP